MRPIVACCEVSYSGRLSAYLPESTRLLMLQSDGSVLVHADAGGYKPLELPLAPATPCPISLRWQRRQSRRRLARPRDKENE